MSERRDPPTPARHVAALFLDVSGTGFVGGRAGDRAAITETWQELEAVTSRPVNTVDGQVFRHERKVNVGGPTEIRGLPHL